MSERGFESCEERLLALAQRDLQQDIGDGWEDADFDAARVPVETAFRTAGSSCTRGAHPDVMLCRDR
ncbi:hypothetical protein SB658_23430, partial [Bacillus sp. SIMBA_008]|uniref:hypothetical protein n=1 Tax=Bacillus sp. SIMBA_008 TaxID=3085757 RepID=UPI00397E56DF